MLYQGGGGGDLLSDLLSDELLVDPRASQALDAFRELGAGGGTRPLAPQL